MINIESIKGKIRNLAEKKNLKSLEVLQIYFFERFLERLSKSKYKNNFVIKGEFPISSLIGVENRTNMVYMHIHLNSCKNMAFKEITLITVIAF